MFIQLRQFLRSRLTSFKPFAPLVLLYQQRGKPKLVLLGLPAQHNHREAGFTLIEIMVVIAIIGILATLIVPNIMGRPDEARITAAKHDVGTINQALKLYRLDIGRYPTTEQGLKALVEKPTSEPIPQNWKAGGYLSQLPKDPWGNSFYYSNPGTRSEIDIVSYGARLDRSVNDSIALSARLNAMQSALTHTWEGSGLPTGLPLPSFIKPSSGLGYRIDPISGQLAWHEGTDYPAAHGTPIKATGDGIVVRAGWDTEYGNVVDIKHPNAVITRYAHTHDLFVKVGDVVQQSQVIATVGSTGRSTGSHLHYEVIRGGDRIVQKTN